LKAKILRNAHVTIIVGESKEMFRKERRMKKRMAESPLHTHMEVAP